MEIKPPNNQLGSEVVFTNDATATAALTGIYRRMMEDPAGTFAQYKITTYAGLSADEFINHSLEISQAEFYENALTETNAQIANLWKNAYEYIYQANAVIEGLQNSQGVTASLKDQITGEAKFIRAFCHLYLVNLFGDVPSVTSTDYRVNSTLTRTPTASVYDQIIADLLDAQSLMSDDYITTERVRPNRFAAKALLARTYLYKKDWVKAEEYATAVIDNTALYELSDDLNTIFLKNSQEAILQFIPNIPGINTLEGYVYIGNPSGIVSLSDELLNAFETGDQRKDSWVRSVTSGSDTYYYPYKYKVDLGSEETEYYMVLRLAEQYLIRAEARAQQNKTEEAIVDLNAIRARAGLDDLSSLLTQSECLEAVEQERRVELFCEWGHRWIDLKRTNRADAVLTSIKSNWQPTDVLYPIPQVQLQNDAGMKGQQNPGY